MKALFIISQIVRETEKAVLVATAVAWAAGAAHQKEVWFPKSTILASN